MSSKTERSSLAILFICSLSEAEPRNDLIKSLFATSDKRPFMFKATGSIANLVRIK